MSKDKKTVLMPVTITGSDKKAEKIADEIYQIVPDDLTAYITGASLINQDFAHSSEEGLKKTEVITVCLIIGLLLFDINWSLTSFSADRGDVTSSTPSIFLILSIIIRS